MLTSNPINVRGIDHIVLRTTNLERLVSFYTDVLGCRLERGPGGTGLAQLRAGTSLIDILAVEQGPSGGHNVDHLCVFIAPWEEERIIAHLRRHGVTVGEVVTRYGALGRGPSLYIDDPDGNTVELKGASTPPA